jgi:segregation and condensation protein B
MEDLKKKVEAILFSTGKYISLEEISRLLKKDIQRIKEVLLELQADYETKTNSSLIILSDGDMWKLTTREEYGSIIRNVVTETELTKSQMETLAVIAFKYPIKQSDLIKIRTNKAYDHLSELEKAGFITRQKYGRSRLIKLTDKFFDYFDLPREKLKERFKGFGDLAKTIETKEEDIERIKEEQRKAAEEAKVQEEKERKIRDGEIDIIDDKGEEHELEKFGEQDKEPKVEEVKEKLGELEVVDEEPIEEKTEPGEDKVEELKSVDDVLGSMEKEDDLPEDEKESQEDNLDSVEGIEGGKEEEKDSDIPEGAEEDIEPSENNEETEEIKKD